MNKNNFYFYKKIFGRINHHQLLDEYVLHNLFACYLTLLIGERNIKQYKKLKRRKMHSSMEFALCIHYVTPFLNKTTLSKSFCSLRSGFQRAIYDASKFSLVLAFYRAFETIAHVKQWLMLFRRCFDDSEILVGLLCSFHLTSALRLVSSR